MSPFLPKETPPRSTSAAACDLMLDALVDRSAGAIGASSSCGRQGPARASRGDCAVVAGFMVLALGNGEVLARTQLCWWGGRGARRGQRGARTHTSTARLVGSSHAGPAARSSVHRHRELLFVPSARELGRGSTAERVLRAAAMVGSPPLPACCSRADGSRSHSGCTFAFSVLPSRDHEMLPRASVVLRRRRMSTGQPNRDHPKLAALLSVLTSPLTSSTPLPLALSRTFPSPSDAFPLRTLPRLLPLLPSPVLSLRFLLWRLTHSSPLPSPHALSSLASSLPDFRSSVPLLLSSAQPLPLSHYAVLLNIATHAGLFPASLAVLRHMRSFGIVPDTACFHHALRAAGSPGDVSAVLEIMSESGTSPTVPLIVTAVHKLASAGDFESARRLIDKMLEFGCVPNVVVYTALIDGMCSLGDVDAAFELLEEMEGGKLGATCAPNVVTYTCLLKCLSGKGNLGEALSVLDRMAARGVLPNRVFIRTLIEGICAEQMVADAYAVVERLVGVGSLSSEQCYNVLLVCLWRSGRAAEAEGLAQRMMKKGVQLTPVAGSSMVRELCGIKRFLDAFYWLGVMDEKGVLCDSDVYAGLLLGLCEEGHVLEASALGRKVVERGIHIDALCADRLVQLLKQYGDEKLASQILGLRRWPEELSI